MLSLLTALVVACDPPSQTSVTVTPIGATTEPTFNLPIPDVTITVTCPFSASATCNAQIGRIEITHPSNPARVLESASNGPAVNGLSGTVTRPVPGSVATYLGSTVVATAHFSCGIGLAGSAVVTASSAPTIIPPRWSASPGLEVISWESLSGLDVPVRVAANEVPAGLRFTPAPQIHTVPRGGETATVRVVGPGLDFTGTFTGDGGVDSFSYQYTYDPSSKLTVTGPGTGRMWVEYQGLSTAELALTFVGSATGGGSGGGVGGGSSATGGGSSSGGGGGSEPPRGCGCAEPGGVLVALVGLWLLRGRR